MKFAHKRLLWLLVSIFILSTQPALSTDTLVLATRAETLTNRFVEQVLAKAYAQIGISTIFDRYPGARSVVEANKGLADGEVARLEVVLKSYKNLRKIPIPLFYSELSAFTRDDYEGDLSSWQALHGQDVVTISGFKLVETKLAGKTLIAVENSVKAIQMVQRGRADITVLNRLLGRIAIAELHADNIAAHETPLAQLPVFHFLHKKHEALIPRITAALETMQTNGSLHRMWEDFIWDEILKAQKRSTTELE